MTTSPTVSRVAFMFLAACLVAAPSAWGQPTQAEVQKSAQEALQAHEQKDYAKFTEIFAKLHEQFPSQSNFAYNLACGHALLGEKNEAYKYLQESIKLGFRNVQHIEADADFESMRNEERFKLLLHYAKTGEAPPVTADSVELEVFTPPNLDPEKKYPVIVALHGYGRNPARTINNWKEAAEKFGTILVAPQGVARMSSSAFHWGDNLGQAVPVVAAAVEKACKDLPVDPDQVVLTGFSQGGTLAYEAAKRHPELFCGLIPVAGRYTAKEGSAAGEPSGEVKPKLTKVFIMVGADDRATVTETTEQAVKDFEAMGCQVKANTYAGVGHAFPENRLEEQLKALKFILGK